MSLRNKESADFQGHLYSTYTNPSSETVLVVPNQDHLRLDSSLTEKYMEPELNKIFERNGVANYVFDYRKVDYISASALRAMVAFSKGQQRIEKAQKVDEENRKQIVILPSDRVREVLHLAGLDSYFRADAELDVKMVPQIVN